MDDKTNNYVDRICMKEVGISKNNQNHKCFSQLPFRNNCFTAHLKRDR